MTNPPTVVTSAEARVIRLARALWKPPGSVVIADFLGQEFPRTAAPGLRAVAWKLVEESCARGSLLALLHYGAWQSRTEWRNEQTIHGATWERLAPAQLGLTFSTVTAEWLLQLALGRSGSSSRGTVLKQQPLTLGDRVFAWQALRHLQHLDQADFLWQHPEVRRDGLIQLLFAEDLAEQKLAPQQLNLQPDFSAWLTPTGEAWSAVLLEEIARNWSVNAGSVALDLWRETTRIRHRAALTWLKHIEDQQRLQLGQWVCTALQQVITENNATVQPLWRDWLTRPQPLQQRQELHQLAWSLVELFEALALWTTRARRTGFLDEGYTAAQGWLSWWEVVRGSEWLELAQQERQTSDPTRSTQTP